MRRALKPQGGEVITRAGEHMRCLEICAGIGGMSLGLKRAGFEHVALIEDDAKCVETLRRNGFCHIIQRDVRTVEYSPYRGVDLVAGGVPCQAFSVARKNEGARDARNLWPEAIRAVRECAPRYCLFENSSAMATRHRAYLDEIVRALESLGFYVSVHVVDAAHYGVPQHRKRLLLVGSRDAPYAPPPPSPRLVTVRQAIASLGRPSGRNGHTQHTGEARSYKGHTPNLLDRPCKAIVAGVHGPGGGCNVLQLDDGSLRYLTPREIARIQTFPDSFQLPETWSTAVRQLGNACPPRLIEAFARGMARASL